MLELLLKARAPERYRERVDISGRVDHHDMTGLTDAQLRQLAAGGR